MEVSKQMEETNMENVIKRARVRAKDMTKEELIKELEEQIKDFSKESEVSNE